MNRMSTALAVSLTMLPLAVAGSIPATAAPPPGAPPARASSVAATGRHREIALILSVLDRRTANPEVRRRAADKLVTLSDRQIRLIASLSERVSDNGAGPAAGIALLLITALLIRS
jgi:hypothetical protein